MKTQLEKVFGSVKPLGEKMSFKKMRKIAFEDRFGSEELLNKKVKIHIAKEK